MIITNRSLNMLGNEIVLDGKYLQSTECSMFLGIKIDNKLKFTDQLGWFKIFFFENHIRRLIFPVL